MGTWRVYPSEIFCAWEKIAFTRDGEGLLPAGAEEAWLRLWDEHVGAPGIAGIDVQDAALLCTLGWKLAMERADYPEALRRAECWFEHPGWESAGKVEQQMLRAHRALALWCTGTHAPAVAQYRELLASQRPHGRLPLVIVRNDLEWIAGQGTAEEPVPVDLAALAQEVAGSFRGCARLVKRIVPGATTYAELASRLAETPHG